MIITRHSLASQQESQRQCKYTRELYGQSYSPNKSFCILSKGLSVKQSRRKVEALGFENTRLTSASPYSLLAQLPRHHFPYLFSPVLCLGKRTKTIVRDEDVRKVIFTFHTLPERGARTPGQEATPQCWYCHQQDCP